MPSSRRRKPDSLLENFYYETKPILLFILAMWGLNSPYIATNSFVKFNVMVLFALAVYLTFSRLIYRGYLSDR